MKKSPADKTWERKLKARPKWMIGFIELYKKEVVEMDNLLDPYVECHWYSMAIGWGRAKGMSCEDAIEFAEFVSGFEDKL